MKYFLDTEFLEGVPERSLILKGRLGNWIIGKPKATIDLISIGIVSEDGREFYEVSKDFNLKEAWNRFDLEELSPEKIRAGCPPLKIYWIRDNVLYPIWKQLFLFSDCDTIMLSNREAEEFKKELDSGLHDDLFTIHSLSSFIERYGKTNKQISELVKEFVYEFAIVGYDENKHQIETTRKIIANFKGEIDFYAYFGDYDWVVFCWLFGKMINLPNGFPMYCKDLKQMLDQKIMKINDSTNLKEGMPKVTVESIKKNNILFPKKSNEHHALSDAKWNLELYKFLNKL
jgi:hypothetical protein